MIYLGGGERLRKGGEEGAGPKFLKTEITIDPNANGSPNGPILAPAWQPRPFSSQK